MKKILILICTLFFFIFSVSVANDNIKIQNKKTWFMGVEGGVGMYDLGLNAVFTPNIRLYGLSPYASKMNYLLGLIGGFQKYTYEKVGFRFSFGIRGYYVGKFGKVSYDDPKANNKTYHQLGDGRGAYTLTYYDGLFDFVKSGDKRFGMILGIGFEQGFFLLNNLDRNEKSVGIVGNIPIRLGFQTQFGCNIIDFVANLTLGGFSIAGIMGEGFGVGSYNSTLILGYKYLF